MAMISLTLFLGVILALAFLPFLSQDAGAQWSGSQTITLERLEGDWARVHTSVLDYAVTSYWSVTGVLDIHQTKGTDLDISTTLYIPFRNLLYATAGIRRGIYDSDTPWIQYVSFTYRF